jgi:hypothetical protein
VAGIVEPEQTSHDLADRWGSDNTQWLKREGNADAIVRRFPNLNNQTANSGVWPDNDLETTGLRVDEHDFAHIMSGVR